MNSNKKITDRSKELFGSGYGCAESVLMAVCESLNMKSALIPRIASGFCGGISNTNGMCGAVAGGIMALNIVYGRDDAGEDKSINYQKVQQFINDFESTFGSVSCPGLTDCDLSTEEGHKKFKKLNIHQKCVDFTGEATRMVLELI
jgi:C_GCAxxG_C_C family probable redox protein